MIQLISEGKFQNFKILMISLQPFESHPAQFRRSQALDDFFLRKRNFRHERFIFGDHEFYDFECFKPKKDVFCHTKFLVDFF